MNKILMLIVSCCYGAYINAMSPDPSQVNGKLLNIRIYCPNIKYWLYTRVNDQSNIGSVLSIGDMDYGKNIYIYQGTVLDPRKTFAHYSVKDNTMGIVALPKDYDSRGIDSWIRITNDDDRFHELASLVCKENKTEARRLADLKLVKWESRRRLRRRSAKSCIYNPSGLPHSLGSDTNISYPPLSSPSEVPLPILWHKEPTE